MKRLLLVAVVAALTLFAGAGTAWAYWTASGSQAATGTGDTLPQGTTPSGAVAYSGGNATVTLTFTARTTTTRGAAITNYVVKRYATPTGGTAANTFTCTLPGSCSESGVGNGTWYYTDTPQLGNWTGAESARSAGVLVNTARHFAVTAGTSQIAGTAFGLMLTVQNSDGTTDTTYTGAHTINWTTSAHNSPSGTSPTLPANGQYTFSAGQVSVAATSGATLVDAESGVTIGASDGTISGASAGITVSASTASKLTVTPATTTPTAGAPVNVTLTTLDTYGNVATSYAGSATLAWSGAGTGTSPSGNKPVMPTSATFSNGTSTISATFYTPGAVNVAANTTNPNLTGSGAMTVAAGAPASFKLASCVVNGTPTTCASTFSVGGSGKSMSAYVQAFDAYGNGTTVSGSVSVTSGSGNYTVTGSPLMINGNGSPANQSTASFTVTHSNNSNNNTTITVSAGTVSLTFTVTP